MKLKKNYKLSEIIRPLIFFSILFFVATRAWLLFLGAYTLDEPRLGDDSYIYMWKAKFQSLDYKSDYPAIKDIINQFELPSDSSKKVNENREMVAVKVIGTLNPFSEFLFKQSFKFNFDIKDKFLIMEICIMLMLTASIVCFLGTIFGYIPSSLALIFLSVSVFPQHGLSYFVPTVLSLSLGLFFWTYLIRKRVESNIVFVFLFSFLITGIHPIGKAYVLAGIPILMIATNSKKFFSFEIVSNVFAILLGVLLFYFINKEFIPSPPTGGLVSGHVEFGSFIFYNIYAAIGHTLTFIKNSILLCIVFLFSLYICRNNYPQNSLKITGVFLIMCVASMTHNFVYPGELFSRFFVLIAIMMAGFSGIFIEKLILENKDGSQNFKILFLILCILLSIAFKFYPHSLNTIKWRLGSINEAALIKQIELSSNKTILYLEYSNAMQSSILLGAYKNGAVIYEMLGDSEDEVIKQKKPKIIVAPIYRKLNTVGLVKSVPVFPRKMGFSMIYSDRLDVNFMKAIPNRNLSLFVDNLEKVNLNLRVKGSSKNSNHDITQYLEIPAEYRGWISLSLPKNINFGDDYTIYFPYGNCWVKGLYVGEPKKNIFWPWEQNVNVLNHYRDKESKDVTVNFSVEELLKEYNANTISRYLNKDDLVISDNSGLVFLRSIYD